MPLPKFALRFVYRLCRTLWDDTRVTVVFRNFHYFETSLTHFLLVVGLVCRIILLYVKRRSLSIKTTCYAASPSCRHQPLREPPPADRRLRRGGHPVPHVPRLVGARARAELARLASRK